MKNFRLAIGALALAVLACNLGKRPPTEEVLLATTVANPSTALSPVTEAPPTDTETPAPTPTEESAGQFTDEFEGGMDGWSLVPTQGKPEKVNASTENGKLVFNIDGAKLGAILTYDKSAYTDVRIEVSAGSMGRIDGIVSLICRYDDSRWYEFRVSQGGLYQILYGYWNAGKFSAKYEVIADGGTGLVHSGQNEYTVICKKEKLSLIINGKEVRAVKETQWQLYGSGKIAISAVALDRSPYTLGYDWIKVSRP